MRTILASPSSQGLPHLRLSVHGTPRSLDMLGKGPNAGCKSILRTFISAFIASYEINVQMEDNILQLILAILCEIYRGEEEQNNSVTIGVADEHVCVVLGRGGRNINEIGQGSGARIKISDKGDFMFGTASDRKVTITGSTREIRTAENMIMKKVASVTVR